MFEEIRRLDLGMAKSHIIDDLSELLQNFRILTLALLRSESTSVERHIAVINLRRNIQEMLDKVNWAHGKFCMHFEQIQEASSRAAAKKSTVA